MKSIALFLILFLSGSSAFSQLKLTIYNEKIATGYTIFADNDEYCPVSTKIDFELKNLSSSTGSSNTFLVPARTKKYVLTTLTIIDQNAGYGFKNKSNSNYGNTNLKDYADYSYSLPFGIGKPFKVDQGYNGSFSHQNENALDFTMPVGTEIFAARAGVVIKVVQVFNQSCPERRCTEYNNYIILYHQDGTFSRYDHLKQNGALVKEGDSVNENQLIGYSGNVGFSNGPHLHFMAYIQHLMDVESIKTKFKINDGKEVRLLSEKETCTRNY